MFLNRRRRQEQFYGEDASMVVGVQTLVGPEEPSHETLGVWAS